MAYTQSPDEVNAEFYVAGSSFSCSLKLAQLLSEQRVITTTEFLDHQISNADPQIINMLIDNEVFYIE
jgi:hypothetical protein